jgi:hypothetical protein
MFETATITGIFYGTDGAAVTDADVYIVPKRKYLASVGDAAWVPRAVTGRTDASGQIGVFDGTTFTPGIALAIGQHDISVRKDGRSHNGVITVDADMAAAAGATSLHAALQPAPEPELISAAQAARDKAREWAANPENVEVEPGAFSALHHATKADADAQATAADRVATGEDAQATAADRVATGQDAAAAQASAVQAEQSALSVGLGTAAGLRAMWAGADDPPDPWIPTGDTVTTSGAALRVLERFVPSDLFASGESGAFYDPSDMGTLFQDAAGTIPVTGPGDPVGQMLDKSGNGFHGVVPTSAARPVLMQDAGGRNYLDFDGVDDILESPALANHTFSTLAAGFQVKVANLNGPYIFGVGVDTPGWFTLRSSFGATRPIRVPAATGSGGTGILDSTILQVTAARIGPGVDDFHIRANGAVTPWVATGAGEMNLGGTWGVRIGGRFPGNSHSPLRFWGGIYIVRALTDAELAKVDQYLAIKTGVTL